MWTRRSTLWVRPQTLRHTKESIRALSNLYTSHKRQEREKGTYVRAGVHQKTFSRNTYFQLSKNNTQQFATFWNDSTCKMFPDIIFHLFLFSLPRKSLKVSWKNVISRIFERLQSPSHWYYDTIHTPMILLYIIHFSKLVVKQMCMM